MMSPAELAKWKTFATYAGVMDQKIEDFMTVLLLGFVLSVSLAAGGVALVGGSPVNGVAPGPVLVIAPPWGPGAAALIHGAGGRMVGPVSAPFGALASFEGAVPVARLRALGAWGVRDASALAAYCGAKP